MEYSEVLKLYQEKRGHLRLNDPDYFEKLQRIRAWYERELGKILYRGEPS